MSLRESGRGLARKYALSPAILLLLAGLHLPAASETLRDTQLAGGARSLGLGEGGGAAIAGAESLFWTPAGIATVTDPEFLLGDTRWIGDMNAKAGAVVLPLAGLGSVGACVTWQYLAGIEERDEAGNLVKSFTLATGGGSVAYAHKFGPWLAAGASAGFQVQHGLDIREQAMPFGAGLLADMGEYRLGISANGLSLPQPAFQASGSWRTSPGGFGMLLSGGAILREGEDRAGAGVEVDAGPIVRFRAGYMVPFGKTRLGSFSNLTAGLGLTFRIMGIDYAFLPLGDLGQVHRIQATLRLSGGGPAGPEPAVGGPVPGPAPQAMAEPIPEAVVEPTPAPVVQPAPEPVPQPAQAESPATAGQVQEAPPKKDADTGPVPPASGDPKAP